ncbi:class I SAM-dependent methyltransferase [Profundibacterium mesophilum]|uniref:Phosphatidylethanolamine N-methyltransferase n=1 Tax=Profundibacterium mesophilum KAUST100406-0324 TaxID=1037889 RepID=A0A921NVE5_9RHOB|nr:class I SAM-dependent methyltransferase [Profundibacterium mesophilum]KAF0676001.1 phosphatidylethanolamine N-methyltransferase [Profundibacterium mesophilum KAUST100406-0324]
MSFYDRAILPCLTDLVMGQEILTPYRQRCIAPAAGRILEIGAGAGHNFPFYGPGARSVLAIDPSAELLERARPRADAASCGVTLMQGHAEALPVESGSIDCVTVTWTLCSVGAPDAVLAELRRVLRPGGTVRFAEHGLSAEHKVRLWQKRLTPIWRRCAGNCHLDRPVPGLFDAAGFALASHDAGYARGPRPMVYMHEGVALAGPS